MLSRGLSLRFLCYLLPHLTPTDLSLFICYYIMLSDCATCFLNDIPKNKTTLQTSLVPKGTLSSILTVKLLMTC